VARLLKTVVLGWVIWAFRFQRAKLRKFGRRVGLGFSSIPTLYENQYRCISLGFECALFSQSVKQLKSLPYEKLLFCDETLSLE
jgi:hypothetical protein